MPLREVLISLVFLAVVARILGRMVHATSPMRRSLTPVLGAALIHVVLLPLAFGLRQADGHVASSCSLWSGF